MVKSLKILQPETSSDNLSIAETASVLPEPFYSKVGRFLNTVCNLRSYERRGIRWRRHGERIWIGINVSIWSDFNNRGCPVRRESARQAHSCYRRFGGSWRGDGAVHRRTRRRRRRCRARFEKGGRSDGRGTKGCCSQRRQLRPDCARSWRSQERS